MSDNKSDGQSAVLRKLFESNHPLYTPKQIKDASLEELKSDERLWAAYERGWCDFVQSFMSSQLMQTETSMTLMEMSALMRRTKPLNAANRDRLVVPPVPAPAPTPGPTPAPPPKANRPAPINANIKPTPASVIEKPLTILAHDSLETGRYRGSQWPASARAHEWKQADGSSTESWWSYRAGRFDGSSSRPLRSRPMPPPPPPQRQAVPVSRIFASSTTRDRVERSAVKIEVTPPPEQVDYVPTAAEFRVVNEYNL